MPHLQKQRLSIVGQEDGVSSDIGPDRMKNDLLAADEILDTTVSGQQVPDGRALHGADDGRLNGLQLRVLQLLRLKGRHRGNNDSGRPSDGRRRSRSRCWSRFLLELGFRDLPRPRLVFIRRRLKVFDVPEVEVEVVVLQDVVDQVVVVEKV